MSTHPLRALLDDAAADRFPPADGLIDVVPSPGGRADVILGLTGHELAGATARFVTRDIRRLLCRVGNGAGAPGWLKEVDGHDHPRVERASRYRQEMRVFVADEAAAVLVVGRGVCDRWECGFEVAPGAQRRGLGRKVAQAVVGLVPDGVPLWAQVAPGNAASLRALGAAGFVPVGAEVLFPRSSA